MSAIVLASKSIEPAANLVEPGVWVDAARIVEDDVTDASVW
jgi:hypothetical protein